jgi:hypothetical protein
LDEGKTAEQADNEYVEAVEEFKKKYGIRSEEELTAAEKAKLAAAKASA